MTDYQRWFFLAKCLGLGGKQVVLGGVQGSHTTKIPLKDSEEMGASWKGVKREALNNLE